MQLIRFIRLGFVLFLLACCYSCGSLLSGNKTWLSIQPGMTYQQVLNILGNPDYRRFNYQIEEWEYIKTNLSGNQTVILIGFSNDKVVNMNSFPVSNHSCPIPVETRPTPPVVCPEPFVPAIPQPEYPYHAINNREFEQLYQKIKDAAFKDEQLKMLSGAVRNRHFTCKQGCKLIDIFPFDTEKMKVIELITPHLTDGENYETIIESLTFSSNKEKIRKEYWKK
ncbi:MAG: DUF4476 domain-containing protein [Bacteroidales bacterium]